MTKVFILFIFLYSPDGFVAEDHIEFPNVESCKSASLAVYQATHAVTFCEPKNIVKD